MKSTINGPSVEQAQECSNATADLTGNSSCLTAKTCTSKSWALKRYPLVNIQKAMERSTIFNGKIH